MPGEELAILHRAEETFPSALLMRTTVPGIVRLWVQNRAGQGVCLDMEDEEARSFLVACREKLSPDRASDA